MSDGSPSQVLVTGHDPAVVGQTIGQHADVVSQVPPKPGEMPAVIVGISAARALGFEPRHDLKAGTATVRPEFSEQAK